MIAREGLEEEIVGTEEATEGYRSKDEEEKNIFLNE